MGNRVGRPKATHPEWLKKFRSTPAERREFRKLLTGDARKDFLLILEAVRQHKSSGNM